MKYSLVTFTLLAYIPLAAATQPGVILVEPPPGILNCVALCVNSDGTRIGGYCYSGGGTFYSGFVWSSEAGVTHYVDPERNIVVHDVSDVSDDVCASRSTGPVYTFRVQVGNPLLPASSQLASDSRYHLNPRGMNADGTLVYGERHDMLTDTTAVFTWRPGDAQATLLDGTTPRGTGTTQLIGGLTSMDNSGSKIIGNIYVNDNISYDGVWIDGIFEPLKMLPGHTGAAVRGAGISRNGVYYAGSYNYRAALWKDGEPIVTLYQTGEQINGFYAVADHGRLAVNDTQVWTRERGLEFATDFFAAHSAPIPQGWNLGGIANISADGSVFVGYLRNPQPPGIRRGFIARTTYAPCYADFNSDGGVDGADVQSFFETWQSGTDDGDVNLDGGVDGADIESFFIDWMAGGCIS